LVGGLSLKCDATWSVVASGEHTVGEREEEINDPMLPKLIVERRGPTQCQNDKKGAEAATVVHRADEPN